MLLVAFHPLVPALLLPCFLAPSPTLHSTLDVFTPLAAGSQTYFYSWEVAERRGDGNGMVQASSCGGEGKRGGLHCTGQARPALPTRSVLTQFSVWLSET